MHLPSTPRPAFHLGRCADAQALECCTDRNLPLLSSLALRLGNGASTAAATDAACAVHRRSARCVDPFARLVLLDVLRRAVAQHSATAAALMTCCRCAQDLLQVCGMWNALCMQGLCSYRLATGVIARTAQYGFVPMPEQKVEGTGFADQIYAKRWCASWSVPCSTELRQGEGSAAAAAGQSPMSAGSHMLEVELLLALLQQPALRAEAAQTLTRAISHGVVAQDQARPLQACLPPFILHFYRLTIAQLWWKEACCCGHRAVPGLCCCLV